MKARIDCAVYDCMYNNDGCCSAESIKVGGESAQTSDGTACETFAKGSVTNSTCTDGCCNGTVISCIAENCLYNENKKCELSAIEVQPCHCGNSDCTCSKDTCCDSFQCR